MAEVDAGIDHRDQHLVAGGERVRLADAKLGERVLRRIADRRERSRRRGRRCRLGVTLAGGTNVALSLCICDARR